MSQIMIGTVNEEEKEQDLNPKTDYNNMVAILNLGKYEMASQGDSWISPPGLGHEV